MKIRMFSKVAIADDDLSRMNSFFCAIDNDDAIVANVASVAGAANFVNVDVANVAGAYKFGVKGFDSCSLKILGQQYGGAFTSFLEVTNAIMP